MKQLLIDILPPALLRLYGETIRGKTFQGPYNTWSDARAASTGYDSSEILRRVRDAARKVRDGKAVFERDSVLFEKIEYSWPVLSGILWAASRNENRLSLVDFGGSLCSSYYQSRNFLKHLEYLRWSIVEQKHFVAVGKKEFENQHVRFYTDLVECHRRENPKVLLFSGVLQYMEDPYEILEKAISLEFEFIIMDRILLFDDLPEEIAIQIVPPEIYPASYPVWFLARHKLLEYVSPRYEVVSEFDSIAWKVRFGRRRAADKGFLLKRKDQ